MKLLLATIFLIPNKVLLSSRFFFQNSLRKYIQAEDQIHLAILYYTTTTYFPLSNIVIIYSNIRIADRFLNNN
jgi:hypothetical protein